MQPYLALPLALGLILAVPPASLPIDVSQREWKLMLQAVQKGGVIELRGRRVDFARLPFQPLNPVTIKGGIFGPITLDGWRNVAFEGATFVGIPGTVEHISLVTAYNPENLTLKNCRFFGYTGEKGDLRVRGAAILGGRRVAIEDSHFIGLSGFTKFIRTDGVRFVRNDLKNIREGLNISGARNILIEENLFEDFKPHRGDHTDAIQFFSAGLNLDRDVAAADVIIRRNLIKANGVAQGIFLGDEINLADKGRGYNRFIIEENIVIGAVWHGITVDRANNPIVRNNILIKLPYQDKVDNRISARTELGLLEGNEASAFVLGNGVKTKNNRVRPKTRQSEVDEIVRIWLRRFRGRS